MADDAFRMEVHRFPMLDTGIGREAGYENDTALIAAAEAERAEVEKLLTPEAVERIREAERDLERRILGI